MKSRALLLVADHLYGGLGAAVLGGARFFRDAGWQVSVAAPGAVERALPDGVSGVDIVMPATARRLRDDAAAARGIRRAVRSIRPDVVHCHGLRSFMLCRLGARVPAFVTQHGTGPAEDDPPGYHRLRRLVLKAVPKLARGAFSASTIDVAGWRYLPHASPRLAAWADREPPDLPDGDPTILWLGLLDPPKRPDLFIEGLAAAPRALGIRGLVAGGGDRLGEMQARAATLGAPVTFLGSRPDVAELVAQCHAVSVLSDFWAGGFALQEAMWLGRTVLVSDLVEHEWLVGDAGLRCRTAADVRAAAVRIADAHTAATLGRDAARRIRSRLHPLAPWPELLSVYELGNERGK